MAVNAYQAEDWNGASGREFIEQRERHERMLGRLRARLLAAAQVEDGDSVLDVGPGCGELTILAGRAAGSGHALGADLSAILVAEARRLAAAAGVANVRFEVADAQVHPFGAGSFDVVLSSFGVMFFDDGAAAFANLRKALRRGGRLAFLCWRAREENPVFTTGFDAAAADLGLQEMSGPGAAFSLASTNRAGALLEGAGFGGIEFAKADEPMLIGRDVDDVLEYELSSPTATGVLAGLSPAQAAELTGQVRDRLAVYASPDGVVMPGAAWLVTAQAVLTSPLPLHRIAAKDRSCLDVRDGRGVCGCPSEQQGRRGECGREYVTNLPHRSPPPIWVTRHEYRRVYRYR